MLETKLFPALSEATQMFHSREGSIQHVRNSVFGSETDRMFQPSTIEHSVTKLPDIDAKHSSLFRLEEGLEQVLENTQSETNAEMYNLSSQQHWNPSSRATLETMIKQESRSKLSVVSERHKRRAQ